MTNNIINRLYDLGADISCTIGDDLMVDLQNIRFKEVLHFKGDEEPFDDFYETFYEPNQHLANNPKEFIQTAIDSYYVLIEDEAYLGQAFWQGERFTPLSPDTKDYDEWADEFKHKDLSLCLNATNGQTPEFLMLVHHYGYPDYYFICLNDVNPNNPTVFSTDHETYFDEIEKEGTLSEFVDRLMSKEESRLLIQDFLEDIANE